MKSNDVEQLVEAIRDVFGTSEAYTDTIGGCINSGLDDVAKAISGHDPSYPACRNTKASLCQSVDGMAEAVRELAEAIRSLKS